MGAKSRRARCRPRASPFTPLTSKRPPPPPPPPPNETVVASEKGVVVGRLSFREDGDFIDCRRMGVGGKAIPPNIDKARCSASLPYLPALPCSSRAAPR